MLYLRLKSPLGSKCSDNIRPSTPQRICPPLVPSTEILPQVFFELFSRGGIARLWTRSDTEEGERKGTNARLFFGRLSRIMGTRNVADSRVILPVDAQLQKPSERKALPRRIMLLARTNEAAAAATAKREAYYALRFLIRSNTKNASGEGL